MILAKQALKSLNDPPCSHTLPHTPCIRALVLSSLWSELLSDTKEKDPEWRVPSMNALNEIFTAAEK